ncbi:MAG TPA: M61 family peptidase, partial [Candidatus Angelobacter sp.]|nr:M61 family peptidase [Candidatus Angelobacter sp.]
MTIFLRRLATLAVAVCAAAAFAQKTKVPAAAPASTPIKITVDASRAPEKLLHSTVQIPVKPGPLTLFYPKWIPGEHGPTGPVADLTGLQFYAKGQRLTWRRNLDEMYSFELTVPDGVTTLEARLDLVMPAPPEGFSSGASATTQLVVVSWNQVVLYPKDNKHTDEIYVTPSLKLPSGWHYDTALPLVGESGDTANFQTVSLTTLVDSPVLSGAHFRRIPLTPEGPIQHYIDAASDSESALQIPQDTIN